MVQADFARLPTELTHVIRKYSRLHMEGYNGTANGGLLRERAKKKICGVMDDGVTAKHRWPHTPASFARRSLRLRPYEAATAITVHAFS